MATGKRKAGTDPEVDYSRENGERAARIGGILLANYGAKTEGYETALVDLLADIRHFCDRRSFEFSACDRVAYNHYTCEVVQARTGVAQ